ncbi:TetR/AcrR family transcriptional regulator [Plantactinospora soyae]|uniref:AcrR family transcriptional regulator n=1 Tax=Plantactinospora soyae TaxID=1544732 RepID=A0A927R291_9ACTN|nr:TetR/AcrR family transcriptional regulator [Plantactinospora soyae]MBE1492287.1 AcrR family transcriptional regulator [Plantactinospora soyae]
MPRKVDHEQRRSRIAEAVWTIVALRGLEAVSLRDVAAEAGVSLGQVQHYFKTKDQVLLYACRRLVELAGEELGRKAGTPPEPSSPRAVIRAIAEQTVPTTPEHQAGAAVWYAFITRSVTMPELATVIRTTWADTHALITEQVRLAQRAGEVDPRLDPAGLAATLQTVIDGVVPQVLVGHRTGTEALAIVDEHLDLVFDPAPSRRQPG